MRASRIPPVAGSTMPLRGYAGGVPTEAPAIDPAAQIAALLAALRHPNAKQPSSKAAMVALNLCNELQEHLNELVSKSTAHLTPDESSVPARSKKNPAAQNSGNGKALHHVSSTVSFQAEPTSFPAELETSEIRQQSSVAVGGLARSSSMTSFAGGQLPILLPGKLQWVRNKHVQLDTLSKLKSTQSLGSLGVHTLPSEMFFGRYDEDLDYTSRRSILRAQERLGPLADDDFYSYATPKKRLVKERKGSWSQHSFDRMAAKDPL